MCACLKSTKKGNLSALIIIIPPPVILHLSVNSIQVFVCETKANAHLCVVFTCSIVNGPLLPRGVNEQRAGVVAAVPFGNTSICSGLIA